MYYFYSGGLEEPDIVSKIVTDETDFIDFENSKSSDIMIHDYVL